MPDAESPAEIASQRALEAVFECLGQSQSFLLEAGAGAGKTYSLVKSLQYLIAKNRRTLPRRGQQIACITFTNVAKDEIISRTDGNPLVYCDTNHGFCWSLINGFQSQLKRLVVEIPKWQEMLREVGGLGDRAVQYALGHRAVRNEHILLHHDDVLPLTISLMEHEKFRALMTDRFPIVLIDEYQDTDADWVEAIKRLFLGKPQSPLFGFFGDHWQKIYGDGCGELTHDAVRQIGKEANFRSVKTIVDCLNRMRPELRQFVKDPEATGEVRVFHSNAWVGQRLGGNHWKGDLPADVAHRSLKSATEILRGEGWDLSPRQTKILMLTHRGLANEQGYGSLPTVFRYNESFSKREHPHVAFLVDVLEPACDAYAERRYGEMFAILGSHVPLLKSARDKEAWSTSMDQLMARRADGTVGQVIAHLRQTRRPRLPDAVEDREHNLQVLDRNAGEEMPDALAELERFHAVSYKEIQALRKYHEGHSPFETKHGVKGAEFENVIIVLGRGWNQYNFGEMLEWAAAGVPANKQETFERNRNLFYVCCSRPKTRLALLFTQQLSAQALGTLENWFGADVLTPLRY